jgi:urease gamma subunit
MIESMEKLRDEKTIEKAMEMKAKMNCEDGVLTGVESFQRNLPMSNILCEVSIFEGRKSRLARLYCQDCGLKISLEIDKIIHREK